LASANRARSRGNRICHLDRPQARDVALHVIGVRLAHGRGAEGGHMFGLRSLTAVGIVNALTVVAAAQPATTPAQPSPPPTTDAASPADPPAAAPLETTATAPAKTTGLVRGRVTDARGEGVPGAIVTVPGTTLAAIADPDGNFELADVPAGTRALAIEATGFATRQTPIDIGAGRALTLAIRLAESQLPGEEIIVTGSRLPEKRLDAPVTVEIINETDLKTAAGPSYLSALSRVKGIDYSEAGIGDQRISARGFATQFNSRMLTMVDGRLAQLPGNGLPQGNLVPAGGLDMKGVEVVVGPASALYGPNAHTGVVNIVTKTPWDDSGAAVMVRGGTQQLFSSAARVAGIVKDRFGWKVNGEYLRAHDFEPSRSAGTHDYGTSVYEGDLLSNYDVFSAKADGMLYYKQGDWLASAGGGWSDSTGFSITNAGRNHLRDWQVQYQMAQLSGPHVYAQVTRTASDAGKSYQLDRLAKAVAMAGGAPADPRELDAMRDSIAFVDNSSMVDSELQLRYKVAGVKTTFGGQVRHYAPSSAGTYLDDKDEAISITEAGSYIQLDTMLFERLRLAGAARVDHHSLYATQVSPKAAVQYEVASGHNVRVGYNRAFKSPTVLENFLRINDILLGNRSGYEVRDGTGAVLAEIAPLRPEKVDSIEIGYKAAVAENLYVDAVGYDSWYRDFISPLSQLANPAGAMPTFGFYADGTPVAAGTPLEGTLFTYANFGKARVRGTDIGVDYRPIPELGLSASGSAIQLVSFENDSPLQKDLTLNAPTFKLRGSVQTDGLGVKSSFLRLDGRYHTRYAFESGYWNTTNLLGHDLPARFVVDVTAGYKFPDTGLTVSGTISNLLDNTDPDVLGAPVPHRFAWIQVGYDFDAK
jgi:outer membrane receptor for ferrienterochelin and colicins